MSLVNLNSTTQVFETPDAFDVLRDEWNALLRASTNPLIFLTWEWQSNWWASYHPGELWMIAVRDEGGQLIGLAPWFIDPNTSKGRLVRSIGCVDVTDYLHLLLREGYEGAVLEALTAFVHEHADRYDGLEFCNIPQGEAQLTLWPPLLESAGYTVSVTQQEVCPIIPLPDSWEGYLGMLDKKQRGELRRKLRRIEAEDIQWMLHAGTENLDAVIERFIALMRSSHPDKAAFMDDPQNEDFFRRVTPVMAACGWLNISILQINGVDAAAYLSFDYNNHILLYNSGLNPATYDLSPGIVLLCYIIEDAIKKGRKVFDFLRGDEEYKYRLGGTDTPVMLFYATLPSRS